MIRHTRVCSNPSCLYNASVSLTLSSLGSIIQFYQFLVFVSHTNIAESSGSVGRALDWGWKGCWFEPHCRQRHCVVSLSKTLYPLLSTGSTSGRHIPTEKLLTGIKRIKDKQANIVVAMIINTLHWRSYHYAVMHMCNKNSNIQGRPHNAVKVIFHTIRNCS